MRKLLRIVVAILALLGVLFIVLLLWPEEEEETNEANSGAVYETEQNPSSQEEVSQSAEEGKAGGSFPSFEELIEAAAEQNTEAATNASSGTEESNTLEMPSVSSGSASATIMIYMNGSDLESNYGEATEDIAEMLSSGIGKKVNVVIQTMGTREWQDYGISSHTAQRYSVDCGSLRLIQDDLGQLDCTVEKTLSDFISFSKTRYPADRYILLFWNHGGGPVYGFGYDEFQNEDDALTLDEMARALSENRDISFDIIGMDCCIMGSLETCCALSPYCRYTILSEDFESGLGWSYTEWMRELESDPGMSTQLLGQRIIDTMISANEADKKDGDSSTMAMIDESAVAPLYAAWVDFAYAKEEALLNKNYSRNHRAKGRGIWETWNWDDSDVTLSDYYISDLMALAESVGGEDDETDALKAALMKALTYFAHTSDTNELTGLAVTLPYGDATFYRQLKTVYTACGFDSAYIEWLGRFTNARGSDDMNDYSVFEEEWSGWSDYESDYGWDSEYSDGNFWDYLFDDDYLDDSDWYSEGNSYSESDSGGDYLDEDAWEYDYEDGLWYQYDNGVLYAYDEENDELYAYDMDMDKLYFFDEEIDDWQEVV